MQVNSEFDLKEIFGVLLKRAWMIVIAGVLGFSAAYFVSENFIPPMYRSAVHLHVNNSPDSPLGNTVHLADINAAQRLVNTYIVILQNDVVMEELADKLVAEFGLPYLRRYMNVIGYGDDARLSLASLRGMISMSSVNNTEVLLIQAQTGSPELSARICNAMTEIAPEIIMRVVGAGSVEVIGEARPAGAPSSPRVLFNSAVGALLGIAFTTLVVLVVHFLDDRIKDEEGLLKRYKIPVLAEIPDFKSSSKRGYSQ
ncbi:MAG: Wzz/FepE/Etk N-terminal domain-containing protein [Defluviitaleaceae bacterium]|nr:Wzz/FepE/Etk N-terminal domain-containing protein [Defluviitaleaceae bacterium]